jgi:hypothetical protein
MTHELEGIVAEIKPDRSDTFREDLTKIHFRLINARQPGKNFLDYYPVGYPFFGMKQNSGRFCR